jgi:hypothetical protein
MDLLGSGASAASREPLACFFVVGALGLGPRTTRCMDAEWGNGE